MTRLLALTYVASIAAIISQTLSAEVWKTNSRNARNIDSTRTGSIVSPNNNRISEKQLITGSPLFLLHLLKFKHKFQRIEKIPTTPPTADCICVPYYLCDVNQTIITDGMGTIDIRYRRCTGDLEVCCYLPTVTESMAPIVTPTMTTPTTPTTPPTTKTTPTTPPTTPTPPPIIFPTVPATIGPTCICVPVWQCDPNGVIGNSGEGVINPRQQYPLCPVTGQVCCLLSAIIQVPTNPPTTAPPTTPPTTPPPTTPPTTTPMPTTPPTTTPMPTTPPTTSPPVVPTTISPGQTQICFLCGNTIQCISGVIITSGTGVIDPRLTHQNQQMCSVLNSCCSGANQIDGSVIVPNDYGPLKNPDSPYACYCVKSWLCTQGNAITSDTVPIDPRFIACTSADEVCCKPAGINLRVTNMPVIQGSYIVNPGSPSSQLGCGVQNKALAPAQSSPTESGKTYFGEFPWMVALLTVLPNGQYLFQCGASIISSKAVLTAAHCVTNRENGKLVARFGQWDLESSKQPARFQELNVVGIVSHPLYYNGGLFHDIAVLILEKPITYDVNVSPICLPQQGVVFAPGTRCYGTGWGRNSFGPDGKYQAELRKVDLPVVDRTDCQTRLRTTRLGQYFVLHGSFMCAGGEVNKDTCGGDGGGPLACPTASGQYTQAGIVSWGIGCGTTNIPAVYTSVSQHRQWIDQQLANYGAQ